VKTPRSSFSRPPSGLPTTSCRFLSIDLLFINLEHRPRWHCRLWQYARMRPVHAVELSRRTSNEREAHHHTKSYVHAISSAQACGSAYTQSAAFTSATILLFNMSNGRRLGLTLDPAKMMEDVHRCMYVLKQSESRWSSAGRFWYVHVIHHVSWYLRLNGVVLLGTFWPG
jgi:hypothetical protein